MPTRGIWAPWPGARLLLALFLPFLTRGGGIALAVAKPLVYPRAQLRFLTPRSPISWLQEEVPLGSAAQSHPAWGEGGGRVDGGERCASGVPKSQVPGTLLPGTSRASGPPALLLFPSRLPRQEPLWPVKLCTPELQRRGQPGLGDTRAAEPARLGPGWPGAPSSPCMNVYFIRTDADHGI